MWFLTQKDIYANQSHYTYVSRTVSHMEQKFYFRLGFGLLAILRRVYLISKIMELSGVVLVTY